MTGPDERRKRLGGMRGMIASRMMQSLQSSAQMTFHSTCDATALFAARQALKGGAVDAGVEDILILALREAIRAHPDINAHLVDKEIRTSASVNIGVAIALPDGLVAPTVFGCESLSLGEISARRRDLVARALNGSLSIEDMSGGTITITNVGGTHVDHFTPILNLPQVAIVGFGQIAQRAVVMEGSIVARRILPVSLTVDHRAIDGHPAGQFLTALCQSIEAVDRLAIGG